MRFRRWSAELGRVRSSPGSDPVVSNAVLKRPVQSFRQFATCALVALSVAACGWTNAARASMVTYTLTGGEITGTLNGTAFTNASFTMTATADPSLFVTTIVGGQYVVQHQVALTTMTLTGFAPFQITQPNWGPMIADFSPLAAGAYFGGFAYPDSVATIVGAGALGFPPVPGDLITGGATLSVSYDFSTTTYATSAGDLVVDGFAGSASFTSVASGVPEIDPAGMGSVLALVGGSLGVLERRRRRTA